MTDIAASDTIKCKLEYIPVIPFRPDDNVIKWYMDMMVEISDELGINHLFVHADEAIYSKVITIML